MAACFNEAVLVESSSEAMSQRRGPLVGVDLLNARIFVCSHGAAAGFPRASSNGICIGSPRRRFECQATRSSPASAHHPEAGTYAPGRPARLLIARRSVLAQLRTLYPPLR
jgi:hypothetical protein